MLSVPALLRRERARDGTCCWRAGEKPVRCGQRGWQRDEMHEAGARRGVPNLSRPPSPALGARHAARTAGSSLVGFFFWSPAGTPQRFAVVRGSRRMSSRHNKRTCPRRADPDLAWARRWERVGSLGPLVPIPRLSQGGLLSALGRGLLHRLRIVLEMSGSGAVPPPRSSLCSGVAWSSPAWWESSATTPKHKVPGVGRSCRHSGGVNHRARVCKELTQHPWGWGWITDIQEAPEPPRSLARLQPVSGGLSEMF